MNKEETLALTDVLIVYYRHFTSRLGRLDEASTLAQELSMDPVAMVHIEMADAGVAEDVVVDPNNPVPHSRIHRRIEGTVNHV